MFKENSLRSSEARPLFLVVFALMGFGLIQVYSSSYVVASETYGDALYFFKRQAMFVFLALAVLLTTARLPYSFVRKWGAIIWITAVIGVFMTFIPGIGVKAGGAIRWISLPFGFRVEPSEILKISLGIFVASLLTRSENFLGKLHWSINALLLVAPIVLLYFQPDFGSFAILWSVGFFLLFAFGLKLRYVISAVVLAIPAFYFLVMAQPYRRARVLAFLDPWADADSKGFQVIQSMLSMNSGGFLGVGLGQGQGKLFFLPEAHTDFTLAVYGEEMGFFGILVLLAAYGYLVFKGFQIALRAEDLFQKTVSLSVTLVFAFSVFINAGMAMGLLPTKGLALPFLSYGGSSLLSFALAFGLLLNFERTQENRL